MDSDDICLPNRIKESYEFLVKNNQYGFVSGCSDTINEAGSILAKRRFTLDFELIKLRILTEINFTHNCYVSKKYFKKRILLKKI